MPFHALARDTGRESTRESTGSRPGHVFRPRFPKNNNADDPMSPMYDGKRMRKAIHRKTVDYNPSILKYLQVNYFESKLFIN